MLWEQSVEYAALTDVGLRRRNNQDAWAVRLYRNADDYEARGHLFLVADGMGGHAVGELASKMAADIIPHTFDKLRELQAPQALKTAIETASSTIHERGQRTPEFLRMGTTCSTLLLRKEGAWLGHVGDSRVYRIRRRIIDQLTRDHSLIWELIAQRKIHPRQAEKMYPRNVITRSLGPDPVVLVDLEGPIPVQQGDTFVLCSDGLSTMLDDSEIGMIAAELPADEACKLLVHLANLRGGTDNITTIVVRTGASSYMEPEPPATSGVDLSWTDFLVWCCMAIGIITGFLLVTLSTQVLAGAIILTIFCAVAGGWVTRQVTRYTQVEKTPPPATTVATGPYRTALARVSPEFVRELARLEGELRRAARDDNWPVAWDRHSATESEGRAALEGERYALALREYGRSIDLLLAAGQSRRTNTNDSKPNEMKVGKKDQPTPISIPVFDPDATPNTSAPTPGQNATTD